MIHQKNAEHVREAMVLIHPTELHKRFIINKQYKTSKQCPLLARDMVVFFVSIAI
jgi:hypothetical protein